MLLSPMEVRRITLVSWKSENNATIEETAEQFECSVSAVSSAERWYRDNRLHNLEATERLLECRAEKRKQLRWLERKMKAVEKYYRDGFANPEDLDQLPRKKKRPVPISVAAQFSREWDKIHTGIAELDGLINRVLNVNVGGVDGNELKITLHTDDGSD